MDDLERRREQVRAGRYRERTVDRWWQAGYAVAMQNVLATIGAVLVQPGYTDDDIVRAVMEAALAALILHDHDDVASLAARQAGSGS